ncbi:PTS transporter subunit EIIC [Buchananella hordeovulneris]|uniref:PTS transporter subunit EIIC n=1 Tax=Buchananella hordeovulneris TaxID=52770 RepID=UPI000F5F951D|nr:PTS transporter subunit EIIC [Buchananella hordeovulneris]RRD45152.1 PTS sugar transporter subunit IIA [Buchananella hordeovulneris]RRD53442.1 PTS sugar transporter subunit IIA [Buchananella hordeovulneris]
MLPIATLPAAGLLLRFGQGDMLGADGVSKSLPWMQPVADILAAAGGAVFGHLPLIFAVGVAVGFAKKGDGSTGVAGLIGYLIYTAVTWTMAPIVNGAPGPLNDEQLKCLHEFTADGKVAQVGPWNQGVNLCGVPTQEAINYGVLGGIVIGIIAALLWQKFYRIKLPDWLAFFGGRRFVPIITAGVSLVVAVVMSFIYPAFKWLVHDTLGGWLVGSGNEVAGGFVFGTVNRLLIPFGLHHLINSIPWFTLGTCANGEGAELHGDLTCFFNATSESLAANGGWTPGAYMAGFFPIMMFALPAAALAIWRSALPGRAKATGALMTSVALTAFLTGITEPLEYAFAYVAFPLYAVHAVLTGVALAVTNLLGISHGFGFSAGAIDYLLNFGKSAEYSGGAVQGPILLLLVGLIFGVIYYFLFSILIKKFNFKTPGREEDDSDSFAAAQEEAAVKTGKVETQKS